jgi:tetratricopeptide (TPR) repeat protein
MTRNPTWYDNYSLFSHDVNISANSAKGNCMAGGILLETALELEDSLAQRQRLDKSIHYLMRAIAIHPAYDDAHLLLGNAWYHVRNFPQSFDQYLTILNKNPHHQLAEKNFMQVLAACDSVVLKIEVLKSFLTLRPDHFKANYNLGNILGQYQNNIEASVHYLVKAQSIRPGDYKVAQDLGVAYGMLGKWDESVYWTKKAIELNPNDPTSYINLGVTYRNTGNLTRAHEYFKIAEQFMHHAQH